MEKHHRHLTGGLHVLALVVGGTALAVVLAFAFGYLVMLLWNWLMPTLFGLKTVTYWQAAGLVLLARLIFGSMGHGSHGGHHGHHHHRRHHKWEDGKWEECDDHEGWGNWQYYDEWWEAEGKEAFRQYAERMKDENKTE